MSELTTTAEPREWTKSELVRYVGGLSNPSKMPCSGYSLPAPECITGSKLRVTPGTTCSVCYAHKGRFRFPKVRSAMYRRLESIVAPLWPGVMAELIRRSGDPYFRWHDSGDLQSIDHLQRIVDVCLGTPKVRHWLPTREYQIVQRFIIDGGVIPANLNVRVSAHMVDGPAPAIIGFTGSIVSSEEPPEGVHTCPAPLQEGKCGDCRACWDRGVDLVNYHVH